MSERTEKASQAGRMTSSGYRMGSTRQASKMWSRDEIRRLRELAEAGIPTHIIAATLCRTVSAVKNKAGIHGISVRNIGSSYE